MPLAEAREQFTLSEMVILAWRGQEQYWNMKTRLGEHGRPKARREEDPDSKFISKRAAKELKKELGARSMYDDPGVDTLPDRFFNEEGELDLSKVTGAEAVRYMNMQSQGHSLPLFPIPMMGGPGRGR